MPWYGRLPRALTLKSRSKVVRHETFDGQADGGPIEDPEAEVEANLAKTRTLRIVLFAFIQLIGGIVYSLQSPFFPAEAEKKGLRTVEYGLVIASYEVTGFLYFPILDRMTHGLPNRNIFFSGIAALGVAATLFGFLDQVNGPVMFFALSVILRILEAIGATTTLAMANAAVYKEFVNRRSKAAIIMESSLGTGASLGPTVGGVLFQYGGFTAPFLAVGVTIFLTAILAYFALPAPPPRPKTIPSALELDLPHLFRLLWRHHSVFLGFSTVLLSSLCVTGMMATMEPSLRKYNLSSPVVGLVFFTFTGTYTLAGILWSRVVEETTRTNAVTLFGVVTCSLGYACCPLAELGKNPILGVAVLGLALVGLGLSATWSSSIHRMIEGVQEDYKDPDMVFKISDRLWASASCFGGVLGPILSGLMVDNLPSSAVPYLFIGINVGLILPYAIATVMDAVGDKPDPKETTPLLKPDPESDEGWEYGS